MALCRGAVDVLMVVIPQGLAGGGLGRLGDRQGHVRLERQQTAIQVTRKVMTCSEDKKPGFSLIKPVLLKAAHVIFAAARRLIQRPQRKGGPLLGLQTVQTEFHLDLLVPSLRISHFFCLFYFIEIKL